MIPTMFDTVVVSDPISSNATHEHNFTGIVIDIDSEGCYVEDQNQDVYYCTFGEIKSIESDEE